MDWENEFEKSTGLSVYTVDEKHEVCYCKEYVDWLVAKLNKPTVNNLVCHHQKRQWIPELNKDLCLNCGELIQANLLLTNNC